MSEYYDTKKIFLASVLWVFLLPFYVIFALTKRYK